MTSPVVVAITIEQQEAFHRALREFCVAEAERLLNLPEPRANAVGGIWLWIARRPYFDMLLELMIAAAPEETRRLLIKVVSEV